jgi:hypothetical protein
VVLGERHAPEEVQDVRFAFGSTNGKIMDTNGNLDRAKSCPHPFVPSHLVCLGIEDPKPTDFKNVFEKSELALTSGGRPCRPSEYCTPSRNSWPGPSFICEA